MFGCRNLESESIFKVAGFIYFHFTSADFCLPILKSQCSLDVKRKTHAYRNPLSMTHECCERNDEQRAEQQTTDAASWDRRQKENAKVRG